MKNEQVVEKEVEQYHNSDQIYQSAVETVKNYKEGEESPHDMPIDLASFIIYEREQIKE